MWKNCNTFTLLVKIENGTATMEDMVVPEKLKVELPCDPEIQPLDIYLKELKSGLQRVT